MKNIKIAVFTALLFAGSAFAYNSISNQSKACSTKCACACSQDKEACTCASCGSCETEKCHVE